MLSVKTQQARSSAAVLAVGTETRMSRALVSGTMMTQQFFVLCLIITY